MWRKITISLYLNVHTSEAVSRYRDPQLEVVENYRQKRILFEWSSWKIRCYHLWLTAGPEYIQSFLQFWLPIKYQLLNMLKIKRDINQQDVKTVRFHVVNPLTAKLFNLNFHPLEVVSHWRDPQLQVSENYSDLTKWRSILFKFCWLMSHFTFNIFKMWYLMW